MRFFSILFYVILFLASKSWAHREYLDRPSGISTFGFKIVKDRCLIAKNWLALREENKTSTGEPAFVYDRRSNSEITCANAEKFEPYFKLDIEGHYLVGFNKNLMFVDSGTGPGMRGLDVYDLKTKKKIFATSALHGWFTFIENTITYIEEIGPGNQESCKDCKVCQTYFAMGSNPSVLYEKVTYNIKSKKRTRSGKVFCEYRQ